jgi:hypothetical protein
VSTSEAYDDTLGYYFVLVMTKPYNLLPLIVRPLDNVARYYYDLVQTVEVRMTSGRQQ